MKKRQVKQQTSMRFMLSISINRMAKNYCYFGAKICYNYCDHIAEFFYAGSKSLDKLKSFNQ